MIIKLIVPVSCCSCALGNTYNLAETGNINPGARETINHGVFSLHFGHRDYETIGIHQFWSLHRRHKTLTISGGRQIIVNFIFPFHQTTMTVYKLEFFL